MREALRALLLWGQHKQFGGGHRALCRQLGF
jgi:hypothetical protein